jgi:hypothetical protein
MPACDPYSYSYSKACPYPNYGYQTPTVSSSPSVHLDFWHHLLGTSKSAEILNVCLIILVLFLVAAFIILPVAKLILDILDFRHLRLRKLVFLELTPPAVSTKSPHATTQFIIGIHGLLSACSRTDRLLRRRHILSEEVVKTRTDGIRFIVPLDPDDVVQFQQLLTSYLPTVRFREIEDYLPPDVDEGKWQVADFKQLGHFAYGIDEQVALQQHDPIPYIAGPMSNALPEEVIAYQLIISPASRRRADKVRVKLLHGQDPGMNRSWWHYPFIAFGKLLKLAVGILTFILETISDEISGVRDRPKPSAYAPPPISPVTQHRLESIQAKLDQPLFNVSVRFLVVGDSSGQRLQGLANSLRQFDVPGFQGFVRRQRFPKKYLLNHRLQSFASRLPAMLNQNDCVLSASELAALYHFPYGEDSNPENLVRSHSRSLPASADMKRSADNGTLDVTFGVNEHHDSYTPIGLTAAERERHVYIVGGTGNGKTTMLMGAVIQDIGAGKGVAVVDPHGDLAETLLKYIPESRVNDVIYFNPKDVDYPVGLNLLELPANLSDSQLAVEQDFVTEAIVSLFRKTFSEDDSGGHRIETILRNTIRTAFTVQGATLFTLYDLLTDDKFRKSVVSQLDNKRLVQFWNNEFAKAGNMQRVKMMSGVTNKLGRFDSSIAVRRVMEQEKSTINFDNIINSGKILICNFAKGSIGEDTAELFGTAVLTKLQLAALRRVRIQQAERKPYYLYVDEFQHFATQSFLQMLSEARKYKLFLTMAEQSTAQQAEHRLVQVILDNVGTVICFRVRAASEQLLLPIFEPPLEVGEIASLPAYNYYVKINALKNHEPLSGETVLLDSPGSSQVAKKVVRRSRKNFTSRYAETPATKSTVKDKGDKPKDDSLYGLDDEPLEA